MNRENANKVNSEIAKIILLMLSSFFLLGAYPKSLYFHYLYQYHLLLFLAISFILANISRFKYLISLIFVIICLNLITKNNIEFLNKRKEDEFSTLQKISQSILNEDINYENLQINVCLDQKYHCTNYDSFNSMIWYHIEDMTYSKLGYIDNIGNGNNYVPYSSNNEISNLVIVCFYNKNQCIFDSNIKIENKNTEIIYEDDNVSAIRIKKFNKQEQDTPFL
jgi:hypothetical protein